MTSEVFERTVEVIGTAVDGIGVAVIVLGAGAASAIAFKGRWTAGDTYTRYRQHLGRAILLGLEFLVAGDIIRTVAVRPTFTSVGVLAAIVAVRTFLSWSLELEITGRWPWQSARPDGRDGHP